MSNDLTLAGFLKVLCLWLVVLTTSLSLCCGKASTNGRNGANSQQEQNSGKQTSNADQPADQKQEMREPSLVSLSTGAFPVKTPSEANGHSTMELMDERPIS